MQTLYSENSPKFIVLKSFHWGKFYGLSGKIDVIVSPNMELNVFNYSSFRAFLYDYVRNSKRKNRGFSLSKMAKKMGLANTASLSRVVKGDREPGESISEKLSNYFQFDHEQKAYFKYLILLDKTKDDSYLKTLLMEKLKEIHPEKQFALLDERVFKVISSWHYFVLREMVRLENFVPDYELLAKKLLFKITPTEIKEALHTLEVLGLIQRDSNGRFTQQDLQIETQNDVASEASKRNHEENLDNAKWALRNVKLLEREFNSVCFTLKKEHLPEAKSLIRQFKRSFLDKFEAPTGEGEEVYQLQVQLFPFTKASEKSLSQEDQGELI